MGGSAAPAEAARNRAPEGAGSAAHVKGCHERHELLQRERRAPRTAGGGLVGRSGGTRQSGWDSERPFSVAGTAADQQGRYVFPNHTPRVRPLDTLNPVIRPASSRSNSTDARKITGVEKSSASR